MARALLRNSRARESPYCVQEALKQLLAEETHAMEHLWLLKNWPRWKECKLSQVKVRPQSGHLAPHWHRWRMVEDNICQAVPWLTAIPEWQLLAHGACQQESLQRL